MKYGPCMMYGSWDIMCKGQSFVSFWVIFCLLTLLTTQNFEKIKKCLEILSFYTCLPQMLIIQCLAPEISSMTEFFVILGHFLPFDPPNNPKNQNFEKTKKAWRYYNFTLVYCKCWSYDVWLLRYQVWQTEFFVILGFFFLPFYRPNNPENQNFEKNEKRLGDIIILHMSTMNQNHMMYDSWDTARNRNFSHFGPFFVLLAPTPSFPLLTTQRIKILKKWKKTLEILFYTNVP